MQLKVLVVDDSVVYRKAVRETLQGHPGIQVVGAAANGRIALEMIDVLRPDLLTLDVEMPQMGGLDVLRALQGRRDAPGAIMLSAFTRTGAKVTIEALHLGAFDFVPKPQATSLEESQRQLRRTLLPKVEAFAASRIPGSINGDAAAASSAVCKQPPAGPRIKLSPEVVGIGVSTGGPEALARVIPQLPANFRVPLLVVQHMPPMFTRSLAEDLDRRSALRVCEAEDGQVVQPGWVYVAPGGRQMKVAAQQGQVVVRITDDPPVKSCRPSVDYLFRSLAQVYRGRVLAVVMTGMGDDGADGCECLRQQGATIVAQDQASCVVYGMPRAVVERQLADFVVPLDEIPLTLQRCVNQKVIV